MTISLAARCEKTAAFGAAVTTSAIGAGARCPFVRPGTGAALTQYRTDPRLGSALLDELAQGATAELAVTRVVDSTRYAEWRQLACVDAAGRTAWYHGARIHETHGHASAPGVVVIGNCLANDGVPEAVLRGFVESEGPLASRLIEALAAGVEAGGEPDPLVSAAVLVASDAPFPDVDLRIDRDEDPVTALRSLWNAFVPERDLLRARALDPERVPET